MARTGHSVTILTATGDIVPNAPIEIRFYSTGLLANIYERDGTPITQLGATADENGIFRFWAEAGEYFARHSGVDIPVTVSGVSGGGGGIIFADVANMISGTSTSGAVDFSSLAANLSNVKTLVNNTLSMQGGTSYKINTLVQERIDRDDLAWEPDGTLSGTIQIGGSHYVGGGTEFVAVYKEEGQLHDVHFGVVGHDKDGVIDDYPALNLLFEACKRGKALGGMMTGGAVPYITPRSKLWISDTIGLIDFRVSFNWGSSELRPITPITCINYESTGTSMTDLYIWYDHLPVADVLAAQKPAITFSGGQPVAVTSESVFSSIERVLIYNAWRGFQLNSVSPEGGLIFQFRFVLCTVWDALDRAWYMWSVAQVSTTTTFENCHTKNVSRDKVQHNGKVYRALQHMSATTIIEPDVHPDSRDYWLLGELAGGGDEPVGTSPAWASGTQYRTNGRGYLINNIQTVTLNNCSCDGTNNFEEGSVLDVLNSSITINGGFHLEGCNLNFADNAPIILNSDMSVEALYTYDLRINMPSDNDRAPLIGGNAGRQRGGSMEEYRNHDQNAVKHGNFDVARMESSAGMDFVRFHAGMKVGDTAIVGREKLTNFSSARQTGKRSDLVLTLASTGDYYKIYEVKVGETGSGTPLFQGFSDTLEITANTGNDDVDLKGRYSRVAVNVFAQVGLGTINKVRTEVSNKNGDADFIYSTFDQTTRMLAIWVKAKANGQICSVNFKGRDAGRDFNTGKNKLLLEAVEGSAATVEAMDGFAVANPPAGSGEWIEVIPAGSYSSGVFNLPSGVVWTDITSVSVVYSETTNAYFGSSTMNIDQIMNDFSNKVVGFRGDSDARRAGVFFNNSTYVTVTTDGSARITSMRIKV